MKRIVVLLMCLPFIAHAQEKEISWAKGLNWEQVKQKARQENKYILLDVFATWCVPCKMMDKNVFSLDSVSDFMQEHYIAVKVQADETDKDDAHTVAWRGDAKAIIKEYSILSFPNYLFFSPPGILVDKQEGYVPAKLFMNWARQALTPQKQYIDPRHRYDSLIERYAKGDKDYSSMFYMQEFARLIDDTLNWRLIRKDLENYLGSLSADSLFTERNLKYIASVTSTPTSKWFPVFYKQQKKVNQVMKDNNYAQRIVDEVILNKVAYPYLKMPPPGMLMIAYGKLNVDSAEADWKGLENTIKKEFGASYAKRNTLATQFRWYKERNNLIAFAHYYFKYLDLYGINSHDWTSHTMMNDLIYANVFFGISDKNILSKALYWMKRSIDEAPWAAHIDTYASLLYKNGQKEEAINWQQKAVELATANESKELVANLTETLQRMKNGEKLDWYE